MFLVKSDGQTYSEHMNRCMDAWQEIWFTRERQLINFAAEYSIPYLLLRQKSILSVLFHDFGKLSDSFQETMQSIKEDRKVDRNKYFRHEILSAIFLFEHWLNRKNKNLDDYPPYEVWAVLGHHKTIDPLWNSFEREKNYSIWPSVPDERVIYAKNFALKYLEAEGSQLLDTEIKVPPTSWKNILFPVLDKTVLEENKSKNSEITSANRIIYSLIKGILHYCDWWASSNNIKYH